MEILYFECNFIIIVSFLEENENAISVMCHIDYRNEMLIKCSQYCSSRAASYIPVFL